MPRFEPFSGVRYDLARVEVAAVTAPPYDVIDAAERAALLAGDPHNVVAIDLPDEHDGPERYRTADMVFRTWLADGTLRRDAAPSFYLYRMGYTDDRGAPVHTLGVIGALALSGPDEGQLLPHERTTPKARSDRLDLLRATGANLSPIWGLSLTKGLTALCRSDVPPDADWADAEGVRHTLWCVTDPERIAALAAAVAASPVVIADGHHRYETSLAYRDERRRADGTAGEASLVMAYIVELAEDELTVRPIHRLLTGLPAELDVVAALREWFEVGEAEVIDDDLSARLESAGALGLVEAGDRCRPLVPLPALDAAAADDLDSARLDAALVHLPAHTLGYQHGVEQVRRAVRTGDAQYGVLLRPATVAQIERNAHQRRRMPPKTTFFHPKPRTGVVFRTTR